MQAVRTLSLWKHNLSILLRDRKQRSCLGDHSWGPSSSQSYTYAELSPAAPSPWELMEDQVVEPCVEVIQRLHDLGGHWHSAWGGPTVSEAYESLLMCTGFLYKGKSQVGGSNGPSALSLLGERSPTGTCI